MVLEMDSLAIVGLGDFSERMSSTFNIDRLGLGGIGMCSLGSVFIHGEISSISHFFSFFRSFTQFWDNFGRSIISNLKDDEDEKVFLKFSFSAIINGLSLLLDILKSISSILVDPLLAFLTATRSFFSFTLLGNFIFRLLANRGRMALRGLGT